VISTTFEYSRATSLDDALARLRAANGGGKLVAGGHSLIPLIKLRLSEPGTLIDIARIPGLSGIRQQGAAIEIGACTVHHDVATSRLVQQACPMLAETAAAIGDLQVRNRGTIGGSLAHADPAADYPAAMLALDADIQVVGAGGPRVVKASSFFTGLFTADLAADEVIVRCGSSR
jgi:carbon-monoxide dehydrogenase medium subunit